LSGIRNLFHLLKSPSTSKAGIGAFLLTLLLAFVVDILLDAHFRKLPNFCAVIFVIGLFYTFCFFLILPTYYSGQIEV
jgi:hypothetical protein